MGLSKNLIQICANKGVFVFVSGVFADETYSTKCATFTLIA